AVGERRGVIAVADQPAHADGRMDRAPSLRRHVDRNEEVARKERRRDGLDPARVTAALLVARQVGLEALAAEMPDRLRLAVGLGLGHIPARLQGSHGAISSKGSVRTPSRVGASTRSRPNCAAAAPNVACAARRSVTTTASTVPTIASNERTTGAPTKLATDALASTTATTVAPLSTAQITAISARSEMPASAIRLQPFSSAAARVFAQSARAWRKNEN